MSVPSLSKESFYGLLSIGPPSAKDIEKARAKKQAKAEKTARETAKKDGKALQKAAIRTSKDKPVYEDTARPAVDAAILELRALPGAGDALDRLMTLRFEAAELAEAGQYTEAVAKLQPVRDVAATGRKAAKTSDKSARERFKPVFDAADTLRELLGGAGQRLGDQACKLFSDELEVAIGVLYNPAASADEADMVRASIAELHDELDRRIGASDRAKQDVDTGLTRADTLLDELAGCVTAAECARIKALVDSARTLQHEREHADAKSALDEVLRAGIALRDTAVAARVEWDTRAAKLGEQVATAKALAANRTAPTLREVTPTAQDVLDGLQDLAAETPPEVVGYAQATQSYDLLTAQLADLSERAGTDAALGPLRRKANEQVIAALEDVDDKLRELHAHVTSFFPDRKPDDLDAPFRDEQAAAQSEWNTGMRRAGADKALLSLAASIVKKLDATCARIDAVIDDTARFTDALADCDLDGARTAFESSRSRCAALIDDLLAASAPVGIHQADLLKGLADQAAAAKSVDAVEALTKRVGVLAAKTQMQMKKYGADSQKLKLGAADLLKSAETKLAAFTNLIAEKSKLDWLREPTKERDYGDMRDLFKGQLDELRALARMNEAGILDECQGDLTALCGYLDTATAAVKGGKEAKTLNVGTVASMTDEIEKLRVRLNAHDVRKYAVEAQLGLTEALDALAGGVRSMPLENARMAIDKFAKDLASAELAAAKARRAYKRFEKSADNIRKQLKGDAFKETGEYVKVLKGKLDKCLADALADGASDNASTELAAIDAEIKHAATDPAALKTGQDAAAADARKAEQDAAEWKSRYEIVVAAIGKNTTMLTKERAELTQLADSANKVYKKARDMQAATMQLRIVNDRLEFLQKYPDGMETAARNRLPKVRDRWKQAVADLKSGLDGLVDDIGRLDPADLPPPAAKAVADSIGAVKNLFDPVLVDAAVDAMSGKTLPKPELSAVREQALRAVHRARAVFEQDQRMSDLSRNPFRPGIDRLIANANLALAEFETNLLISL